MKLVFATNNQNKVKEVSALLGDGIEVLSLAEIGCTEELEETQDTLQGNAKQKARYVYDTYGYNCFADDTGLEITALNGEPGVYSARYAGPECKAEDNMGKVLSGLQKSTDRSARFRTVIHLVIDDVDTVFEGQVVGEITREKSGAEGFGYDPIFLPEGREITFAEMELSEKNEISHRGRAVRKLVAHFG
jgi:XTP/dITP diphosphohydrolase